MNYLYMITVLAWVLGIFYTGYTIILIRNAATYDKSTKYYCDQMRGISRTYPLKHRPIIALISIVWLVAYYYG